MIKGCNRRGVGMKNTGSDMFDEAYFLIKENAVHKSGRRSGMVEAAQMIVEGIEGKDERKRKKEKRRSAVINTLFFFFGICIGIFFAALF